MSKLQSKEQNNIEQETSPVISKMEITTEPLYGIIKSQLELIGLVDTLRNSIRTNENSEDLHLFVDFLKESLINAIKEFNSLAKTS